MIMDKLLDFGSTTIAGSGTTNVSSTNTVDFGALHDFGRGERLSIVMHTTTVISEVSSPQFEWIMLTADDAAFSVDVRMAFRTPLWGSVLHLAAAMPAQWSKFAYPIPSTGALNKSNILLGENRYTKMFYVNRAAVPATDYIDNATFRFYIVHAEDAGPFTYPASTSS